MIDLQKVSYPVTIRLGDEAPDFKADTTDGPIDFYDWKQGAWAVFFSHPADFTPVCTTELGATAGLKGEFDKRNVKAIAISVDTVSNQYDMLHPNAGDTSTVRSVFIIDPANKVRLTLTYPKSVGRNFNEILRVIDALQLTDKATVSSPADWVQGDKVIVSPMLSTADAIAKFGDVEEVKPYLRWTPQPKV